MSYRRRTYGKEELKLTHFEVNKARLGNLRLYIRGAAAVDEAKGYYLESESDFNSINSELVTDKKGESVYVTAQGRNIDLLVDVTGSTWYSGNYQYTYQVAEVEQDLDFRFNLKFSDGTGLNNASIYDVYYTLGSEYYNLMNSRYRCGGSLTFEDNDGWRIREQWSSDMVGFILEPNVTYGDTESTTFDSTFYLDVYVTDRDTGDYLYYENRPASTFRVTAKVINIPTD